jgi:membrane-associated phospholipid phosphatase
MTQSSFLQRLWLRQRPLLGLLAFGVALPWAVFLKASSEIQENEGFPGDQSLLRWLHAHASPSLDTLSLTLTRAGGPLPMSGLAVLIFWYLWRQPHRRAWFFAMALGGAMLLNVLAKAVLGRVRPAFWHSLAPETTPSFPSGHAMGSLALVLTLFLLLRHSRWRWLSWTLGLLFVLGVGWSRMYLGVHYPSDVAAGWVASTAWVLSVYFLFSPSLQAVERLWEKR